MSLLPTNYVDAQLNTSQNTHRIYDIKKKSDNTVVQSDVYLDEKTVYSQEGSEVNAQAINAITTQINDNTESLETANTNISGLREDLTPIIQDVHSIVLVANPPSTRDPNTLYLCTQ